MFELKIITDFAAAHRLAMVTDKCENLHGHNWKVEVNVAGERLNDAGVLIDFGQIKQRVRTIVAELGAIVFIRPAASGAPANCPSCPQPRISDNWVDAPGQRKRPSPPSRLFLYSNDERPTGGRHLFLEDS